MYIKYNFPYTSCIGKQSICILLFICLTYADILFASFFFFVFVSFSTELINKCNHRVICQYHLVFCRDSETERSVSRRVTILRRIKRLTKIDLFYIKRYSIAVAQLMNRSKNTVVASCMRFEVIENQGSWRRNRQTRGDIEKTSAATRRKLIGKEKIRKLVFESCIDCAKMSAIPQGTFAAFKVRENKQAISMFAKESKEKTGKESTFNTRPSLQGWELTPLKYNSKLMNSIWGLYNRYSVHNFKKNTDEAVTGGVVTAIWGAILKNQSSVANITTTEAPQIIRTGNGL